MAILTLHLSGTAGAQVPQIINYQGRVAVGTTNFNGQGLFRFALVNAAGTTTYWSNDGSSSAGSHPTAAVTLTVTKGLYSVLLGDTTLPNMTAIPNSVFNNADVRLRVWFDDGTNYSQLLWPDQRLAAVGYAMIAGGVQDGAITSAKIATGAVGTNQLAANVTLSGNTALTGSLSLPATSSASTGVVKLGASPFLHAYGTSGLAALNTFAGYNAGNFTMTGTGNTATGASALQANSSGSQNTATGAHALQTNNSGYWNTADGFNALFANTTGYYNTAIGNQVLQANIGGVCNTAVGNSSLIGNTTGNFNTATGHDAMFSNISGHDNTASGVSAMRANDTGYNNTAAGVNALSTNTGGYNNTATGVNALNGNLTGHDNIGIGYSAGVNLTNGSNNIDIGHPGVAAESDVIRIGTTQTDTYLAGTLHGSGAGLTNIPASAVAPPPPGMVLIPAGPFTLGNSVAADTDITDAAPVSTTVSAFYMDVNEVTLSQWQAVYYWAKDNGYTDLPAGSGKGPSHPVHTVNWYDVVKWCNARSEQAGQTPVYYTNDAQTTIYKTGTVSVTNAQAKWTANGYRLPTEAEWEKAARGGMTGQRFPWGNTITQNLANYRGDSAIYAYDLGPNGYNAIGSVGGTSPATSPVGSFAANGYGLNDMAGNVFELCWDRYGTPYAGGVDPHGPTSGSDRVIRGGSWGNPAYRCRVAFRYSYDPTLSVSSSGFRIARSSVP